MRSVSITRTMRTTCGKTISYFQEGDGVAKAHSFEGPAIIYPKEDGLQPEYYIYGVKYTKARWQELVNQHKAMPLRDMEYTEI